MEHVSQPAAALAVTMGQVEEVGQFHMAMTLPVKPMLVRT